MGFGMPLVGLASWWVFEALREIKESGRE